MSRKRRFLSIILVAVMLTSFTSVGGHAQEEPGVAAEALVDVVPELAVPLPEEAEATETPVDMETPVETEEPTETAVSTERPAETEQSETTAAPEDVPLDGTVSGTCGDNLTWKVEEGVLTISGTGDMYDYEAYKAPWYSLASSITSVVLEEGVASIGEYAFYSHSAIRKATIPSSVKTISEGAFLACTGLSLADIPEGVQTIEGSAFRGCSSLLSVAIPDSVSYMGNYVYAYCSSLVTVRIGDGVKTIMSQSFYYCDRLETVVVGDGVTTIESSAFYYCDKLESVTFGTGISTIGTYAFHCDILKTVYYKGTEEQWNAVSIDSTNRKLLSSTMHYNYVEIPENACGDNVVWTLVNGVLTISGSGAMDDYESADAVPWHALKEEISAIVIGPGVTEIGARAFAGCTAVKSVELGSDVWYIGEYAFASCGGLTELTIPEGVKTVDAYAFAWCSGLEKLTLPDSLYTIEFYAFGECTALTEVELPAVASMVGEYAFYGCTALEKVVIPVSMRRVASHAFGGCVSIENVYYDASPENWEYILFGVDNECLREATMHYQYKNGVSDIVDMTMGKDEIGFYVYDYARKEPVEGAVIEISGSVLTSGADGCAAVELADGSYNFTLSCDGYTDQNITMKLEGGEVYVLSMMPQADKPTVFAVEFYEGDSAVSVNVLTERGYIKEGSGKDYTLAVTGGYDGDYVSTFCFYQNNEQIFTMNAGADSCGTITVSASEFAKDAPVYVRAIGRDGTKGSMQPTNIHVVPDTSRLSENTVDLGENVEIAVDEDIPLLGGSKLSIELDDLPIYAETEEDGTVRIAINFYEDSWNETTGESESKNHLTRTEWQELKNAVTSVPEELGDFLKMGPDKRFQIGESAEAAFQVWGYLEGNVATNEVAGRIMVVAHVKAEETWQFFISSMPCVIEMEITAEMKAGIGAVMNADTLGEARLEGIIEPSYSVAVGGGPGIAKVATATINGSGELKHKRTLTAEKTTDRMEFTAKLFVKIKLLFMEYTKDFGPKKTWVLYDSEGNYDLAMDGEPLLDGAMDVDNYTVAGRDYLGETSPWLGEISTWNNARTTTQTAKLLQSSVYEDTQLEIVQAGDMVMAFFLTDDPARADIDRTMLVYTMYDAQTDTWSQPVAVEDDGTADFCPSVSTDGEQVWVVWADMKAAVGDATEPDAEAIAAGMDITMAVWENGAFTVKPVTDDEYMDVTPAVYDGVVAWIRSESGNLLGNDDSNVLCFYDGETVRELRDTANVTEIAMGALGGTECMALVTDGDGDYTTSGDRTMMLLDTDGTILQTVASGEVAQLAFAEGGLCWYEGGSLRCLETADGSASLWQGMEGVLPGAWQSVVTGGKTWLLFLGSRVDEETGLTDTELYACIRENGGWGNPVQLTELGMNIQRFEVYTTDSSVGVMLSVSDMSDADGVMTETVSLCALTVIENCDYALLDVECGEFTAADGAYALAFTAEAANIGCGAGGDYTLELRQDGRTVSSLAYDGLGAGGTQTISGVFAMDTAPVRGGEYTVVLCGEDTDDSNNTAAVTPLIDDLSVYVADYSIAHSCHTISLTVENLGIYDTEAIVKVRLGSLEGETMLTKNVSVPAGDRENLLVRLDAMAMAFDEPSVMLYFEVSGEHTDGFEANDYDTFAVFRPEQYEEHTEHSAVTLAAVEPTCAEQGLTEGSVCEVCGEVLVEQEILLAAGHDYTHTVTEPTCTAQGYTTHTCGRCGDSYEDTYTPAAHAWDEGVITVTPGPDEPGEKVYTCVACGETVEQTLVLKTASGDVDMDGDVDIVDVWLVMYHTVGTGLLMDPAPQAADVNGDAVADSRDATQILRYISEKTSVLGE